MPFGLTASNGRAVSRREALVASSLGLASGFGITGCNRKPRPAAPVGQIRTDVPLRILWVGSQDDADLVSRGWSSISEQPIRFRVLQFDRTELASMGSQAIEMASDSDVVVVPHCLVATLVAEDLIAVLGGEQIDAVIATLFPSLRNGVVGYATQPYSLPIASPLPAVLSTHTTGTVQSPMSWNDYDRWVATELGGRAGEPTSGGWAATMFLWRAAGSTSRWLFSRETFRPVIDEDAYVETLEQMATTVARYKQPRQTPDQIWRGVREGSLAAAIGWPTDPSDLAFDGRVSDLPLPSIRLDQPSQISSKVLFDPWMPVIAVGTNCRQTSVAKTFLAWISGGEASDSIRDNLAPLNPVRTDDASQANDAYASWLVSKMQSSLTLPTLQVIAPGRYYEALDQQVARCLEGKVTAGEALAEVSKVWSNITEQAGADAQLRAWRRANGMRA